MLRCEIAGVEATVAHTTHAFPRHSHDRFGIGVVVAGGQRSASGRGPVEARANDVITVNPGEVHDGSPLDEQGRAWRMLYFEPSLLCSALAECAGVSMRQFELTRPVLSDPQLTERFARVFEVAVVHAASFDNLAGEEALLALVDHVARHHACVTARSLDRFGPRLGPRLGPIARAKASIDDDPAAATSLTQLSAEAGMSRFQLLRSFARELGLPPHAYRMQRRVALARHLIAAGTSLADTAAASGFADQSHMTRAFVRLLGVTPANYAQAVR